MQTIEVFVAPGFIDLQVNGFAGVDFNSPTAPHDEIERAIVAIFSTGVTRFFPTVITGAPDAMLAALRNLAAARESLTDGHAMEAFHVEGPHISPEDGPRGAHPREWVRPPDFAEFQRWQDAAQGHVRLVTISPRMARRAALHRTDHRAGRSRLHRPHPRDAAADPRRRSAGATLSTHLGNGAGSAHPHRRLHRVSARRDAPGRVLHRRLPSSARRVPAPRSRSQKASSAASW